MDSSGGATLLDSGISAVIGKVKVQSIFISDQLNIIHVIPLFPYFVISYSAFYRLPFQGEEWSEPRWLIVCACIVPETSALCIILNAN